LIAADSSVMISYFKSEPAAPVRRLTHDMQHSVVVLPPAVVTELLSNPRLSEDLRMRVETLETLMITEGYWNRAGLLRAAVLRKGFKAHLGDALIAQSCIDHGVPLLTSDPDFRHYVKAGGLKLVK
jgi:hypothetical protein